MRLSSISNLENLNGMDSRNMAPREAKKAGQKLIKKLAAAREQKNPAIDPSIVFFGFKGFSHVPKYLPTMLVTESPILRIIIAGMAISFGNKRSVRRVPRMRKNDPRPGKLRRSFFRSKKARRGVMIGIRSGYRL